MKTIEARLDHIEKMLSLILDGMETTSNPIVDKWLTEPQVMKILNLTKRAMKDIRRKNEIRTSSATGRNFKYYKPDVERYLYDNSIVKKRTSAK